MTAAAGRRRAVFLSDLHLGTRHCHAAELADFLSALDCERLYLVGDIVDLWWMAARRAPKQAVEKLPVPAAMEGRDDEASAQALDSSGASPDMCRARDSKKIQEVRFSKVYWGAAENRVIERLHALRRAGTEIVYIPGNHDRPFRHLCGLAMPAMRVRRRAIHVTADGRRLLVVHGDDYDVVTQFGNLQEKFGDWLYYRILTGNQWFNWLRRRAGLRYWSLSEFLKRQSGAAERYIARFVDAGLGDARRRGLDGVVCGHIHRAALFERDGMIYANDGDWVESLTAFVEEQDGSLRLLSHRGETLAELPPRKPRTWPEAEHRQAA